MCVIMAKKLHLYMSLITLQSNLNFNLNFFSYASINKIKFDIFFPVEMINKRQQSAMEKNICCCSITQINRSIDRGIDRKVHG